MKQCEYDSIVEKIILVELFIFWVQLKLTEKTYWKTERREQFDYHRCPTHCTTEETNYEASKGYLHVAVVMKYNKKERAIIQKMRIMR